MADDDGYEGLQGVESADEAALDHEQEPDNFFGKKGEPDYERIRLAMESLREFAGSDAAEQALAAGQKEATLAIHAFKLPFRVDMPSMHALRDAVAIMAYRRQLKWSATTAGPYTPLVQLIYPDMKQGSYYAIAHALYLVRNRETVEGAASLIRSEGGVDAMYRARKSRAHAARRKK